MSAPPPDLWRFVEAARDQAIVPTTVTADAVLAGLEQHRRRGQAHRTLGFTAAIAAAATLISVTLLWPMLSAREAQSPHDGVGRAAGYELGVHPDPTDTPIDSAAPDGSVHDLAKPVSVRTSATVEVRGPWSIALDEGIHELEVAATPDQALRVSLPDRELVLELVEGSATIEVVEGTAAVRLHNGVAAWVGTSGERTVMSVEQLGVRAPDDDTATVGSAQATATQLAREAELLLAAGKTDKAATVLRRLILAYPKATQTRAALLDLARLLRNVKRHDEARCAYQLYLQRWPNSAVDDEVRSQLKRLGPGRGCRGLDPR